MSAPRRDAATRSVKPAQRSTAAASADPPPSPPPCGIALCMCTRGRPAGQAQRPGDEVRVVERHAGGERPVGGEPVAVGVDGQRVGAARACTISASIRW